MLHPLTAQGLSLADPAGSSVLIAAVNWLTGAMTGTIATIVATLGIATIGALMLTGRAPVKRGMTTIIGCFILLGASAIVTGLRGSSSGETRYAATPIPYPDRMPPPVVVPSPSISGYDPYAGASLPGVCGGGEPC